MAERTTTKTVKSIRIKLKNVRIPQAKAVPAENRVHFCSVGHLLPEELKARARKRKAELNSYVSPRASVDEIVKVLRNGASLQGPLPLPRWDSTLELPSMVEPLVHLPLEGGYPSKRYHSSASLPEHFQQLAGTSKRTSPANCDALSSEQTRLPTEGARGKETKAVACPRSPVGGIGPPASCPDKPQQGPGSDTSDHATTSAFAPGHVDSKSGVCAQEQGVPGPAGPSSSHQALPQSKWGVATGPEDGPAGQGQKSLPAQGVGTSVQGGAGGVLPLNFLSPVETPGMLGQFISSLELSDLQMPVLEPLSSLDGMDSKISSIMKGAIEAKRSGDRERGPIAPWRVHSLSKYVEASLMYMEACQYMQRLPRTPEISIRIETLYGQTADLLVHSAKQTEVNFRVGKNELGKETLRILCERLAATCYMREVAKNPSKMLDQAAKVKSLIQLQKQQNGHRQGHVTPSPPTKHQQAPNYSPDGSTVSSHDLLATNTPLTPQQQLQLQHKQLHVSTAAELGQAQAKLLWAGERVLRYADMVRRSSNGFQAVIERPDVREDPFAKLACVHLAATFMSAGMGNGLQLIAHARKALEHIKAV